MIKTKDLVPEIYNTSHDYKIFEALLDAVFNKSDVNSKSLQNLHNPGKCLQENLYRLAAFFDLPTADRVLLRYYRLLRKSKGTRGAVESAIEACGATIKSEPDIVNPTNTNCQITYAVEFNNFDVRLFDVLRRRLIEFNCQLRLIPYTAQ